MYKKTEPPLPPTPSQVVLSSYMSTAERSLGCDFGHDFRLQRSKLLSRRLEFGSLLSKCLVSKEDLISMHLVGTCSGGILYSFRTLSLKEVLWIIAKVKGQSNL